MIVISVKLDQVVNIFYWRMIVEGKHLKTFLASTGGAEESPMPIPKPLTADT